MYKRILSFVSVCVLLFGCCSCKTNGSSSNTVSTSTSGDTHSTAATSVQSQTNATAYTPQTASATSITLQDSGSTVQGQGVVVKDSVVTITAAGNYLVRGSLSDGQLRVECNDNGTVYLIMDGVSIHSKSTAPLFVKKADAVVLALESGSKNTLSDDAAFAYEDTVEQEPSGTLFSKADLRIQGEGSLSVNAVFNDGIVSRDSLDIAGGNITVTAADDAVMGRDCVTVSGGDLVLTSKGDGIKSTNDTDETVGYVDIRGGKLTVTSDKDGIQAESTLNICGGEITVTANGGHQNGTANMHNDFGWGSNSVDSSSDGKGLKAGAALQITGGTVRIDAADDAVHSNQSIAVSGGHITVAAGDDGLHADQSVTVTGGTLRVTNSYEGLEAAVITINDGDVSLTASDDGINASSGNSETSGDRFMPNDPFASDDSSLIINGGTLFVDAAGDGLDSNGSITMSGGNVSVIGPSNSGNGTFDFGSAFDITGGTLFAVGSSGMATTPTSNTMNSLVWGGFTVNSGDVMTVTAPDGTVIAELDALRYADWVYITCAQIVIGEEVTVTCGSQTHTFIVTEGANAEGTVGGMNGGMGGGMHGGGMGRPGGPGDMPPGGMGW